MLSWPPRGVCACLRVCVILLLTYFRLHTLKLLPPAERTRQTCKAKPLISFTEREYEQAVIWLRARFKNSSVADQQRAHSVNADGEVGVAQMKSFEEHLHEWYVFLPVHRTCCEPRSTGHQTTPRSPARAAAPQPAQICKRNYSETAPKQVNTRCLCTCLNVM